MFKNLLILGVSGTFLLANPNIQEERLNLTQQVETNKKDISRLNEALTYIIKELNDLKYQNITYDEKMKKAIELAQNAKEVAAKAKELYERSDILEIQSNIFVNKIKEDELKKQREAQKIAEEKRRYEEEMKLEEAKRILAAAEKREQIEREKLAEIKRIELEKAQKLFEEKQKEEARKLAELEIQQKEDAKKILEKEKAAKDAADIAHWEKVQAQRNAELKTIEEEAKKTENEKAEIEKKEIELKEKEVKKTENEKAESEIKKTEQITDINKTAVIEKDDNIYYYITLATIQKSDLEQAKKNLKKLNNEILEKKVIFKETGSRYILITEPFKGKLNTEKQLEVYKKSYKTAYYNKSKNISEENIKIENKDRGIHSIQLAYIEDERILKGTINTLKKANLGNDLIIEKSKKSVIIRTIGYESYNEMEKNIEKYRKVIKDAYYKKL